MSWVQNLTRAQRRELRRVAAIAYERELGSALGALEEQFRRWRAGKIDAHELDDAVHAFHHGPHRELWSRYTQGHVELSAQYAIQAGIVTEAEVEPGVLDALKQPLEPPE